MFMEKRGKWRGWEKKREEKEMIRNWKEEMESRETRERMREREAIRVQRGEEGIQERERDSLFFRSILNTSMRSTLGKVPLKLFKRKKIT